jgi:HlyD family secretion protein
MEQTAELPVPSIVTRMKKLLLFVLSGSLLACSGNKDAVAPEVKPLMEAVYASGFVVSGEEYQLFSQVDGNLTETLVKEGEQVKKGQPLLVIESNQQNAKYTLSKQSYEMAKKNYSDNSPVLRELKTAIESSRIKYQYDSLNFSRYSNLLKANATSRAEFDRIKLIYENSKNDYALQSSRYEKIKNDLYLALQSAESQWKVAQEESGHYALKSEVDGMVFKIMKEKGELVRRSEAVAIIGKEDNFYLKLTVDELDVQRLKVGQDVAVKIDAYPQKVFKGKVSKVYPLIDTRQQSLRVDATLEETLPGGFSGLAVEANIIVRKKDKAIVVPKSVLLQGDSVWIRSKEGEKKVKVIRGIETLDEVEIVEGIDSTMLLLTKK